MNRIEHNVFKMWAVCELRRGDIAQTYALCSNKNVAYLRLAQLMEQYNHPYSWWKIIEVSPNAWNPNVQVGDLCKVAIWCNWEDDNQIEVVRIFTMNENVPADLLENAFVWIDEVVLL